jgi:hypothetical protein
MNFLKLLGSIIVHLLKAISYRWILDLIDILKRFWEALKGFLRFLRQPHPEQEEQDEGCETVSNPAFHRPDPCIYSQRYLMDLGLAVTWDNPDIVLLRNGVPVVETALLPNTAYEVRATIWNNSYEAPVVGLQVNFSFLSFGVATVVNPIGTTAVNLGVKGGPNHPAQAAMLWTTPPTPGHYCLQVDFDWIDDLIPGNNLGYNNVNVAEAASPATFDFKLRNDTGETNRFRFEVDTYTLPELPECPPAPVVRKKQNRAERLRLARAAHNRDDHPVPPGWDVEISPPEVTLADNDEVNIAVVFTPPDQFQGEQQFNVNAVYDSSYAGGVSLVVSKA